MIERAPSNTPFREKRPLATPHISMIRGGTSKNSSDSDMGRRPKLKSDEFSEVPPIVVEIISILVEICTEIMGSLIGIWSRWTDLRKKEQAESK